MGCICSKSAGEEAQPAKSLQKPVPVVSVTVPSKTLDQFVAIKKDESFIVTAGPRKPNDGSFSRNNSHSSSSRASSKQKENMTQTAPMPQYMEDSDRKKLDPIMHKQSLTGPIVHERLHKKLGQLAHASSNKKSVPLVQPQTQGKSTGGHVRSATVGLSDGADNELAVEKVHDVDPSSNGIGFSGEHVIAGWPSWLTEVAGEAVHGWLPRRADSFEKLNKVEYLIFILLSMFNFFCQRPSVNLVSFVLCLCQFSRSVTFN
jgi:hypothetical protein